MDVHVHPPAVNHASAKKLWNVLRIAFFMLRKGLSSKRKLFMDMHLMMKRGKMYGKNLKNVMFQHGHTNPLTTKKSNNINNNNPNHLGLQEYEFSCGNSPAYPMFFNSKKRQNSFILHHFSSCIHPQEEEDSVCNFSFPQLNNIEEFTTKDNLEASDFADKQLSPMVSPYPYYSRRQSNYTEEDGDNQVDRLAEEFIARFYEQLRMQHQHSVKQYHDMLSRGAT